MATNNFRDLFGIRGIDKVHTARVRDERGGLKD